MANSRQIVEPFIITIHVSEVLLLFKSREKSSFSTFAFWGRSFFSISTFDFLAGLFCMHLLLWLLLWCTRQPFEWNLISSEFDQKIAFGSYFSFQQLKMEIATYQTEKKAKRTVSGESIDNIYKTLLLHDNVPSLNPIYRHVGSMQILGRKLVFCRRCGPL